MAEVKSIRIYHYIDKEYIEIKTKPIIVPFRLKMDILLATKLHINIDNVLAKLEHDYIKLLLDREIIIENFESKFINDRFMFAFTFSNAFLTIILE